MAILESKMFSTVGPNCVLSYYYYLGGLGVSTCSIAIYKRTEDDKVSLGYTGGIEKSVTPTIMVCVCVLNNISN